MSARNVFSSIRETLDTIGSYGGEIKTVLSSSQVSKDSPHRPLLESIRNDLYHYDNEKEARIIFNIESHLAEYSDDNSELIVVLKRVLEIVQYYKKTHQILVSPTKPKELPSERVTEDFSNLPARRKLIFDIVEPILTKEKTQNS